MLQCPPSPCNGGLRPESLPSCSSSLASSGFLPGVEDGRKAQDSRGMDALGVLSFGGQIPNQEKPYCSLTPPARGRSWDCPLRMDIASQERGLGCGKGDPFLL